MRRGRNTHDPAAGFSLFPFLAVLLCTMGALIVLLVVIAQMARAQVQAETVRVDTNAEAVHRLHAQLLTTAEQREEQRQQARSAAEKEKEAVAQLRQQLSALLEQLADAQRAVRAQPPATVDERSLDDSRRRLAWLRRQIAETMQQLRDAQRRAEGQSFAVVPYAGLNGTRRRPIYIECRKDRVVLQPAGIEFTEEDFALGQAGGPLETALRTTLGYLERTGQTQAEAPYPMLLVRPDGVGAYYAALDTVDELDLDYGYELVDEDWDLAFEPPDPRLAQLQARAAHNARDVQRRLLAARGRSRSRRSQAFQLGAGGGLQAVGGGGGFSSSDGDAAVASAADGDGSGPPRAFMAPGGDPEFAGGTDGTGDGPLGAGGDGQESFALESSPTGTPYGSPGAAGDDDRFTTLLGGGPQGRRGRGQTGGGTTPGGNPDYAGPEGDDAGGTGSGPAATERHLSGGPGGDGPSGSANSAQGGAAGSQPGSAAAVAGSTAGGSAACSVPGQGGSQQPVARQRGFNWALPGAQGKTTAIARPIRVALSDSALAILDRRPQAPPRKVVRFRRDTADSVDELQRAVEEVIDGWGIAGGGMYWKPVLRVELAPDGVGRYRDLQALMRGSGIDLEAAGAAARPAAGRASYPRSIR